MPPSTSTSAPSLRRPFSGHVIAAMYALAVIALFTLSGGILWVLGINYDGLTGSTAAKIHPATYLTIATFVVLVVARRNPMSFMVRFVVRYPGALAFLAATAVLGAYIVLDNRHGIAAIFDTYMLAVLMTVIAAELDNPDLARIERLLHVFFAVNAAFGLFEYLTDHRFFPYRFDGALFEMDRRSTAFFGHPLENAVMTGSYIMVLVAGGGATMPKLLRPAAVLLQLAAMVPFGGRTALLLTCAMLTVWLILRIVEVLRGRRMPVLWLAGIAMFAPVVALAVGVFAIGGFFDVIAARFNYDGGSAATRLEMFEIFKEMSLRDILVGGDYEMLESIRLAHGLEWGVENPVVRLLLYQGAGFTLILVAGFIAFMVELGRRLRPGFGMAFVFFLVVINSYESIANKSIMLSQFVVLMLAMFRREQEVEAAAPQRAARVAWA